MRWSLSEFLNLLQARSQCWGFVEFGARDGFRVRVSEEVMFYAMLEGTATISGIAGGRLTLETGETAIVISHSAHGIRAHPNARLHRIDFLDNDEYRDTPHHVVLGQNPTTRLLCSRLKVRWPGGVDSNHLPPAIKVAASDQIIKLDMLAQKAMGSGSAALLTRAAALTLTEALRDHPECQNIFRDANYHDPISRAVQIMELHLHQPLTVRILATKVGMARSTFAERFVAQIGKAPMEALTDLRMERAAGLVTQTRLTLSEIAVRVGYRSQSAFSRRFEKHFDITPGRMRLQEQTGERSASRWTRPPLPGGYAETFLPLTQR